MWHSRLQSIYLKRQSQSTTLVPCSPLSLRRQMPTRALHKYKKYLVLVGGLFLQLSFGNLFAFGNLVPYFASYLAHYSATTRNLPLVCDQQLQELYAFYVSNVNWIYSAGIIGCAVFCPIGGKVGVLLGARTAGFFSCVMMTAGIIGTAFVVHNLLYVVLLYGFLFGSGTGIAYTPSIVCAMKWWPKHRAFVTSIIVFGFGGSAFFFNFIQTWTVNPGNLPASDTGCGYVLVSDVLHRVPFLFIVLGIVSFSMQFIGCLLLFPHVVRRPSPALANAPQRFYGSDAYASTTSISLKKAMAGETQPQPQTRAHTHIDTDSEFVIHAQFVSKALKKLLVAIDDSDERIQYSGLEAMRLWSFWQLFLNSFFNILILCFLNAEWKVFCENYLNIMDDDFLSILGSIAALSNGMARIFWGFLIDYNRSFPKSMGSMTAILSIFLLTLPLCKLMPSLFARQVMVFVWICVLQGSLGGNYCFFPATISKAYGLTNSGVIFGWVLISEIPASITQVILFDIAENGWILLFSLMGFFAFLSCILSVTFKSGNQKKMQLMRKLLMKTQTNGEKIL